MKIAALIFFICFFGVTVFYFFWLKPTLGKVNVVRVENAQLLEQVRLLREEASNRERRQKEILENLEPKKQKFAPKENLGNKDLYKLNCFHWATESARAKDIFQVVGKNVKSGEEIRQLCENTENLQIAFVVSRQIVGERFLHEKSEYYLLSEAGKVTKLATKTGSVYGSCGDFLYWSKNGGLYIKCGEGDGAGGHSETIRFNLSDWPGRVYEEIVETCIFNGTIECTTGCRKGTDCKAGEFCNLETNTCVKSCKEYTDCGGGYNSCVPMGPVMGCELN